MDKREKLNYPSPKFHFPFSFAHCHTPSNHLWLTDNGPNKIKYPVSSSCVEDKSLLIFRGQRSQWANWLETIEIEQELE